MTGLKRLIILYTVCKGKWSRVRRRLSHSGIGSAGRPPRNAAQGSTGHLKSIPAAIGLIATALEREELGSQDVKPQFPKTGPRPLLVLPRIFLVSRKELHSFSIYQGLRKSLGLPLSRIPWGSSAFCHGLFVFRDDCSGPRTTVVVAP